MSSAAENSACCRRSGRGDRRAAATSRPRSRGGSRRPGPAVFEPVSLPAPRRSPTRPSGGLLGFFPRGKQPLDRSARRRDVRVRPVGDRATEHRGARFDRRCRLRAAGLGRLDVEGARVPGVRCNGHLSGGLESGEVPAHRRRGHAQQSGDLVGSHRPLHCEPQHLQPGQVDALFRWLRCRASYPRNRAAQEPWTARADQRIPTARKAKYTSMDVCLIVSAITSDPCPAS